MGGRLRKRGFCLSLFVLAFLPGCGGARDARTDLLKIGAYSVVREVLHDGLLPAFAKEWKTRTGRGLEFKESYTGSGAQARAIASGFDADVAILSHEGDMESLVKAGRVKPTWKERAHGGMVTHSLVVIGVRPGNPKHIEDFASLANGGVGVLYPDPKTSGGARWNINAIYGSACLQSRRESASATESSAVADFLAKVQGNVITMDPSGRQSMANFAKQEIGDAVVTYENEVLLHNKDNAPIPYVVPPATLLIESPAAIVESSVASHGSRELAESFLEFVVSETGQRIVAEFGFRPVRPGAAGPAGAPALPPRVFTMTDLGGWAKIEEELYGPKGLWTTIFAASATARAARR